MTSTRTALLVAAAWLSIRCDAEPILLGSSELGGSGAGGGGDSGTSGGAGIGAGGASGAAGGSTAGIGGGGSGVAGAGGGAAGGAGGGAGAGGSSTGGSGEAGANGGSAGAAGSAGGGGNAGSAGGGTLDASEDSDSGTGDAGTLEDPLWERHFGNAQSQIAHGLAVEPDGDSYVAGVHHGSIDFGDAWREDPGNGNAFLVRVSPSGDTIWSKSFGDTGSQTARSVAVDQVGAISITGEMGGTADFGGGVLQSGGGFDLFTAGFTADGSYAFGQRHGDAGNQYGVGLTYDEAGQLLLAGRFAGALDLGGGMLQSAGGSDALIGVFTNAGAHVWSSRAGNALGQRAAALVAAQGPMPGGRSLFAVGTFQGQLDFGCGVLTTSGLDDVFVAELDPVLFHCEDSYAVGDAAAQSVETVMKNRYMDGFAIAGAFDGTLERGGYSITASDDSDAYVAIAGHGYFVPYRLGGTGVEVAHMAVTDLASNIIVVGEYDGSIDGAVLPPSAGGKDAFVVKYDSGGNLIWAKRFGADGDQVARAVGIDEAGYVYVAGSFTGSIPLAGRTLESLGEEDAFLIKLAP